MFVFYFMCAQFTTAIRIYAPYAAHTPNYTHRQANVCQILSSVPLKLFTIFILIKMYIICMYVYVYINRCMHTLNTLYTVPQAQTERRHTSNIIHRTQ